MLTIGDNTNYSPNSITVTNNPNWLYVPSVEPLFPTTNGKSSVSNAISEICMNVLCSYLIDRVIFHNPATIVIWEDGTKTVVKCHNEPYDREKGLAMCIAKKVLGEKFHQTFREWCE